MNAQQKAKQTGGQAKTGGKKKAPVKAGELTVQDRYQKEVLQLINFFSLFFKNISLTVDALQSLRFLPNIVFSA